MTAGTCPDCGNEYKNLEAHKRFCKAKVVPAQESQSSSAETILKSPIGHSPPGAPDTSGGIKEVSPAPEVKLSFVSKIENKIKNRKRKVRPPIIIRGPDPAFKPNDKLSDSDKLKAFLADLPLWTQYKPKGMRLMLTKMLSPNKTFASMVFVGENRPPRIAYLPYDPEKNRVFIPGKSYHFTPTTGEPFFYHEDYMLPLINTPVLKDRFMLPGHVVEFAHASGLAEGKLQAAGEFLEEIKKYKMVCYLIGGICILLLFALLLFIYTSDNNYKNMASSLANMTIQMSKGGAGNIRVP